MKKLLRILFIVVALIVGTLAAAPFLFKDKIKALIIETANESIKGELYFADLDLSFFRNFPNVRVSIQDFGLVNEAPFVGDTLAQGKEIALVVNLMSVIGDGPMEIKRLLLNEPDIKVHVLADGQANYDIVRESETPTDTTTSSSDFQIQLQGYEIKNATLHYADATLPMSAHIMGLQHQGKGDFTASVYELETKTSTEAVDLVYDGVRYLKQTSIGGDVNMKIDLTEDLAISLLQNQISVNDLLLALEGDIQMPGDDIVMDVKYAAQQTTFGSLLSLVPGVYTKDFAQIKTEGNLSFAGFVNGTYNESQIPGFGLDLAVQNGFFQYPDLPTPVSGIELDLKLDCPTGDLEQLLIDLGQLKANLGSNPLIAQAKVKGIERMEIDGNVQADLNLAELTQMFPIEGTALKGQFAIDAVAEGVYDEQAGRFPQVNAKMNLDDAYVKNDEYPAELSDLHFHGTLTDGDGSLANAELDVPDFHFVMDGEPIDGSVYVKNFDDPFYRLKASGVIDLEKIMQIFPVDSMTLRGIIDVKDFATEGKYSDLEAERYDVLQASGSAKIQNLYYSDLWYVQPGVSIEQGEADFTADKLLIKSAKGKLGQSDYQGSGYLDNYLAYGLMPNQPLGGNMTLRSTKLDINEWMESEAEPTASTGAAEEEPWEVIPVPDYLNMIIQADAQEIIYDDINLKNFSGKLTVANEEIDMEDIRFGMFGSQVAMNGIYETRNLDQPNYNFYLNIADLGLDDAYQYFSPVQAFAPALAYINGITDTELGIKGSLNEKMSPILENLYSLGSFQLKQGQVDESPLFTTLADKTKLNALREFSFDDVTGKFEIQDGFLIVAPIDLEYQGIKLNISGRQSLAGNLDYKVTIDAPSGSVGAQAFQALGQLSGGAVQSSDRVVVNLLVGGTSKAPSISGAGGGTGDAIKDQLVEEAEDKLKDQLGVDVQLNQDSLRAQAEAAKQQAADSARRALEQAKQQAKDSLQRVADEAKKEAEQALEDKAREQLGDSVVNKLKDLKDKFGFPKKKKKDGG
ncbi:MAG: AsmA-like C-terminal region-containing protein, partial [Bacteroidota bacterium]